ncbi:hypothetical protein GCM10011316_22850 [Roseibium aquae]|uniref:Uncharacterized protein n=1 Tax=Roseibium aquae TaxID=1323746 RepID=A0A916TKV6_9HYPH|nr:hypothetical protein GCM10011316_22850 [Roseibium aquae]
MAGRAGAGPASRATAPQHAEWGGPVVAARQSPAAIATDAFFGKKRLRCGLLSLIYALPKFARARGRSWGSTLGSVHNSDLLRGSCRKTPPRGGAVNPDG